jgi:hypothetical protein
MQLHPAMITTFMAERERALQERATKARAKPRRSRAPRRAPWIP